MAKWTRQPPVGTKIDWSNSLTRGLLSAFNFVPGPIRDLVTGKRLTMLQHTGSGDPASAGSVVAPTFKVTKDGIGVDMGLRSGDVVWLRNFTGIFPLNSTTEYSRVIGIGDYSGGLGANPGLWRSGNSSLGGDFDIVEGGDDDWYMRVDGTNRVINPFVGPVVEHQFHGLSFFADGSADLFVDGSLKAETTSAADNFSSETVYNLGVQFNTTDALTGTWTFLAFWNRALQPAEMAAMTANPWQIFEPTMPAYAFLDRPKHTVQRQIKRPWTKQPPAGTPIDFNKPITQGLTFCASMQDGGKDLIADDMPTFSNGAKIVRTDGGMAFEGSLDGSEALEYTKDDTRYNGKTAFTWLAIAKNRKGVITDTLTESIFNHVGAGVDAFDLTWGQGEEITAYAGAATTPASDILDEIYDDQTAGGVDPKVWNALGGIWGSNVVTVCINGRRGAGSATSGSMDVAVNSDNLPRVGGLNTTAFDGWISAAMHWDRALSDAEFNSMAANPWQIYEDEIVTVEEEVPSVEMHPEPNAVWTKQPPLSAKPIITGNNLVFFDCREPVVAYYNGGRIVPIGRFGTNPYKQRATPYGMGYGDGVEAENQRDTFNIASWESRTDITELTIVNWLVHDSNSVNEQCMLGKSSTNSVGWRFSYIRGVNSINWRVPESSVTGISIDILTDPKVNIGDLVQVVGRWKSGHLISLDFYNATTGEKVHTESAVTATSVTTNAVDIAWGNHTTNAEFEQIGLYNILEERYWSDQEIEENRRNMWGVYEIDKRIAIPKAKPDLMKVERQS